MIVGVPPASVAYHHNIEGATAAPQGAAFLAGLGDYRGRVGDVAAQDGGKTACEYSSSPTPAEPSNRPVSRQTHPPGIANLLRFSLFRKSVQVEIPARPHTRAPPPGIM